MIFFFFYVKLEGGVKKGLNRAQAEKPLHFLPASTVWAKARGQEFAKTIFNSEFGSDMT